jgi:subtilisin family serine protease
MGLALIAALFPAGLAAAEPPTPEAADQVIVRYRAGTTAAERAEVARAYGLTKVHGSANGRTEVLVAKGRSSATAMRQLAGASEIVAVSPNIWRDLDDEISDEELFAYLWGLHNTGQSVEGTSGTADVDIDGLEALQIERGDPSVVVAVIDDGVDFDHPDLADRAWINPGEAGALSANGIDDDGNGFIDDVHGWDFCDGDAAVGPNGSDGHGTHVAGTIAASLDGHGVVGVAPGISVMSLRTFGHGASCGDGDAGIIAAIDYAASFGVPIINASWGGSRSLALEAAITDASETLLVASAGNQGSNMDGGGPRSYPAASPNENILSVAAIGQTGSLAGFSNYGATSVDIAAPGENIVSTVPGGYGLASGTSMAAPHVVGVAALALSALGGTPTPIALRARIMSTGVPLASTAGKTVSGRLVNAWRALDVTGPLASPINGHRITLGSVVGSTVSTTMTWPAATDDITGVASYVVKRSLNGGTFATLTSTTARSYKRTMAFGTPTRFQLFARDGAGNVGAGVIGPSIKASLYQDGTSLARYIGSWSRVSLSSASNGRLHRSTRGGAAVVFRTTARAIAIVGRRGPLNGKAKVYVDGVYRSTIDLRRSKWVSRVVVFSTSWSTAASHSVKLVVVGGTGRVDVDAFVVLR